MEPSGTGYGPQAIEVAKSKAAVSGKPEDKEIAKKVETAYKETGPKSDPVAAKMQDDNFNETDNISGLSDEDLVAKRNELRDAGKDYSKYQDEIRNRDKDGKDHFWQADDKELIKKREESAGLENEADDTGASKEEIEEATEPSAQEEAAEAFNQKYDPSNKEDLYAAIEDAGFCKLVEVKDPDGTTHLEALPTIMSQEEFSKRKGNGLSGLWKGLTLASVGVTALVAGLTDGQVVPPILNCMVFDNDAANYRIYRETGEHFIEQLNSVLVGGFSDVAKSAADTKNADLREEGGRVEGKAQAATDEEVNKAKMAYEKEMADYEQQLTKEMHKLDNDLRIEADKAIKENDVDKMLDIAKRVGGDPSILDKLSSAAQAEGGMYNLSPAQTANIVIGFLGKIFGLIPSDKKIKTFVRPNGVNDMIGGMI